VSKINKTSMNASTGYALKKEESGGMILKINPSRYQLDAIIIPKAQVKVKLTSNNIKMNVGIILFRVTYGNS